MSDMNSCSFTGRLGRDAELRDTKNGERVLNARIAVNGFRKEDAATWIGVTMFGKRAEAVAKYLTKGSRIGVTGRLSVREYQGNDGSNKTSVEVIAQDVTLLGDGKRDESAPRTETKREPSRSTFDDPGLMDDDLPF